jgi:hypothetical protein
MRDPVIVANWQEFLLISAVLCRLNPRVGFAGSMPKSGGVGQRAFWAAQRVEASSRRNRKAVLRRVAGGGPSRAVSAEGLPLDVVPAKAGTHNPRR